MASSVEVIAALVVGDVGVVASNNYMQAKISGIYIKGDVIYYQLCLAYQSPVDYDID